MACPSNSPCCGWGLDLSCCMAPSGVFPDPCLVGGQSVPQSVTDIAAQAAIEYMWAATGRQFGTCNVTLNLCKTDSCGSCHSGSGGGMLDADYGFGFPWYPEHLADGSWVNLSCSSCDDCLCGKCSIRLPYPACEVTQVVLGGVEQDLAGFGIYDYKELVYAGASPSGTCDISCGDTVSVTYGRPVPALVLRATAEFACQLIKSCVGAPCQLPQRMSSITRQGISVSFLDPMEFLKEGLTGLYLVDLAVRTYNPNQLQKRPSVSSPDSVGKWRVQQVYTP